MPTPQQPVKPAPTPSTRRANLYEGIQLSERTLNIIIGVIITLLALTLYFALPR